MIPGLYADITPLQYFAECCPAPALTNSGIGHLLDETPADFAYNHPRLNPDPQIIQANAAMRLGDVVHQLALDKGRGYAVGDYPDWRTNAARQFRDDAIANGATPITAPEYARCAAMAAIIKARITAELADIAAVRGVAIPEGGVPYQTEVVICWQEETELGPIWCRGMIDVWCEILLVGFDLKVTKGLHKRVRSFMENGGWDRQVVWYERGLNAIFPAYAGRIRFADLMVHPKPPHTYRAVAIDKAWRSAIEPDIQRAIRLFSGCLAANVWPSYPRGIETLEPTPRKLRDAVEALTADDDAPEFEPQYE